MTESPLAGSTAVVTGASSGLGRHFASVLAAAGANVVATARRGELLEELRDEGAGTIHPFPGDISEPGFPKRLLEVAHERFGGVQMLVNNAGITHAAPAEDEEIEAFRRIVEVNLVSVFACSQAAYPYLVDAGGGAIVNIASALGLVGIGRIPLAAYCAAKGGVVNMTRELAAQWARRGIRVNCLAPGWFPTELAPAMTDEERGLKYIERTVPLGRPGRLAELDEALMLLCSQRSTYLTGQTIVVDGGWTSV